MVKVFLCVELTIFCFVRSDIYLLYSSFLRDIIAFFIVIRNKVFLSYANKLYTFIGFQAFLSHTNIYIVSKHYYHLIIVICVHVFIWFQVSPNNNP